MAKSKKWWTTYLEWYKKDICVKKYKRNRPFQMIHRLQSQNTIKIFFSWYISKGVQRGWTILWQYRISTFCQTNPRSSFSLIFVLFAIWSFVFLFLWQNFCCCCSCCCRSSHCRCQYCCWSCQCPPWKIVIVVVIVIRLSCQHISWLLACNSSFWCCCCPFLSVFIIVFCCLCGNKMTCC